MEEKNIEYCFYCHKRCYSKKEADLALKLAKRKCSRSSVIPKREYHCGECGMWHLTSSVNEAHRQKKRIKVINQQEEFDLSEVL